MKIIGESDTSYLLFNIFWLFGIVLSVLCLLMQGTFFTFLRICRKTDEKILAQITFTRILVTLSEYYLLYIPWKTQLLNDIMFGVYFVSDFALVCLMLAFTKNLYDKIVIVFSARKYNLIYLSIIVWSIALVFGFLGVYILKYHMKTYFELYCKIIFASVKFLIVTLNLFVYIRIFYVAYQRGRESNRNAKGVIKTAFVAFLLVTTTCLQTLISDLISYGRNMPVVVVKTFCVINSYHAVFITAIFIIILKNKMADPLVETMSLRLTEMIMN